MQKLFVASVALAALSVPTLAVAETVRFYDPAEGEFVTRDVNPVAAPVASSADRYTKTVRYYDPAEGEFVTMQVGEAQAPVATNDSDAYTGPTRSYWDPAEGEFIQVPAR
jgi:hypothetical protein